MLVKTTNIGIGTAGCVLCNGVGIATLAEKAIDLIGDHLVRNKIRVCIQYKKNRNYSVPKVAIRCKAFKTLLPFLIVVSITDLRTANILAVSIVLN